MIWLFFVVPAVILIIGLGLRMFPKKLGEVRFADTTVDYATNIVLSYAEGTYENRFGYPTGFYVFDEKASTLPTKIVLKEAQPQGTVTDGCALGASAMGAVGFEEGCGMGCVTMMLAGMVAAPFYIVSALDRLYRYTVRSRVVIDLRSDGADTLGQVSLHGIGANLMRSRYEKVFNLPELPERFALPLEGSAPWSAPEVKSDV